MQVRETTINDPEVVRCLRDNFVPFAADSYKIYRGAKNLGLVARGWNIRQVTSSFHVFAPDGTRIGMTPSAYKRDLLKLLREALDGTESRPGRKVTTVRNLTPDRGVGIAKDGTAKLAVMSRAARRNKLSKDDHRKHTIMIVSLKLTSKQLDALRPSRTQVGLKYRLPERIAKHFGAVGSHNSDDVFKVLPADVKQVPVDAEVTRVEKDLVEVSLRGPLTFATKNLDGNGMIQGRLRFNRTSQLQELLLVYQGHLDEHYSGRRKYPVEGLIEWRRSLPKKK